MLTKLVSNYRPSQVSKYSRRSLAPSSKTYISKLEKQLESEKQARLQLEKEVEEMKKINAMQRKAASTSSRAIHEAESDEDEDNLR